MKKMEEYLKIQLQGRHQTREQKLDMKETRDGTVLLILYYGPKE